MSPVYHRKILRVDLTNGVIEVDAHDDAFYRRNMGGWNVILETLLREVPAGTDPLGPENALVFAPGVLTGLPLSGASRNAVGAKSPLTGAFGASEVGGYWGAELKRAGYDAIIIKGESERPVYLWIKDGRAEIRDANHLWGKTTKETLTALREELDDARIRCTMIGKGGENLVRYACIMNGTFDAAGRCGLGAVMGSKRLKAIAVRGSMNLEPADPDALRDLSRSMARAVSSGEKAEGLHKFGTGGDITGMVLTGNLPTRNFRDGDFAEGAEKLSSQVYLEQYGQGMDGCFGCAIRCKKAVAMEQPQAVDPDYGGPEYETAASLGACCGVDDIASVAYANQLCNAYSLDTIAAGVSIAFAMECYENGLLTSKDADGLDLRFGNGEVLAPLIERIADRSEGIGELLGEPLDVIARRIGGESHVYAMQVKGQPFPMHEPRFKRALAIGYAVSPTGADHCHALHDNGLVNADQNGMLAQGTLSSLGVIEPLALENLGPDKVRAALYHTLDQVTMNCLPMCLFVPWTTAEKVAIVRAATGWDVSAFELMKVGERAFTLARVFNVREGFGPEDDRLPERSYGPTTNGALSEGGIDREELEEAVRTFYGMMGWDPDTGRPTPTALHELGAGWAVDYLVP